MILSRQGLPTLAGPDPSGQAEGRRRTGGP